eukprot:5460039-Pyramimonas_sp.AAC.1
MEGSGRASAPLAFACPRSGAPVRTPERGTASAKLPLRAPMPLWPRPRCRGGPIDARASVYVVFTSLRRYVVYVFGTFF